MFRQVTLLNLSMSYCRIESDVFAPLGLLYVAGAFRDMGVNVRVIDPQLHDVRTENGVPSIQSLIRIIGDPGDALGIGCMYDALPTAVQVAQEVKALYETTILMGGPGPSGVARALVDEYPAVDIVVVGEGEQTVRDLCRARDWMDLYRVDGIVFRYEGSTVATPVRDRIKDLSSIPLPGYDLLDRPAKYRTIRLLTSRGCSFGCSFCDIAGLWKRQRVQVEIDRVKQELQHAFHFVGVSPVQISDDLFTLDNERVERIGGLLSDVGVEWDCFGRVDTVDRRLLQRINELGCRSIFYGAESGSDRVLGTLGKGFTSQSAAQIVDMTLLILTVGASFIWGFPFESVDDLFQTILLSSSMDSRGAHIGMNFLTPTPSSGLYQEFGSTLVFPEVIPNDTALERLSPEYLGMVQQHPRVFPCFRAYGHPELTRKIEIVNRLIPRLPDD